MQRDLIRFGVSISEKLLEKFDNLIAEKSYNNRSEAIRDLIRDKLVEHEIDRSVNSAAESFGTITLIYDHHTREIGDKLTDIAHDSHALIISTMHVHLTHRSCLEVIIVRGKPNDIRSLSDKFISIKGVKHGKLVITGLLED